MTETSPTAGEAAQSRRTRLMAALMLVVVVALFASGVKEGLFLCDDAFISFRYAHHFAEGNGLVWNVGERVEGYSNFLWVLLLGLSMKLGAQPEIASIALGILSGTLLLGAVFAFSARRSAQRQLLTWFPALALAASPSFTAWCTGGLETMFYALLIFTAIASLLQAQEAAAGDRRWLLVSSLLFALANLTRPDAPLFAGLAALFVFGEKLWRDRRLPWRAALTWGLPYAAIVGSHYLWRYFYYGYWFPNTYYAKVNKPWWDQGFSYLDLFADGYGIYYLLPLILLPLVWRPRLDSALLATVIAAWSLYVAKIGGDWMQNRMLVVLYPMLYVLIGDGLERLSRLPGAIRKPFRLRAFGATGLTKGFAALSAVLALLVLGLTYRGNRTETSMAYMGTDKELPIEELVERKIASVNALRFYAFIRSEQGKFLRSLIDQGLLPEDLVFGVGGAGALPYYTMWPSVDFIGLTDAHVAHQQPSDTEHLLAGHQKWGSVDYLRERGVAMLDALNQLVCDAPYVPDNVPLELLRIMVIPDVELRTVKVRDKYLVFATLVPEEEFQRVFGHLEILE